MSRPRWGKSEEYVARPGERRVVQDEQRRTTDGQAQRGPEEIRSEIARTRAHMTTTIDEIEERLDPDRITRQVRDSVRDATIGRAEQMVYEARETARGAGTGMMETIKNNPVPAALAAVGIGWLLMSGSNGHGRRQPGGAYSYPASGHGGGIADRAQETFGQVRSGVDEASGRVQEEAAHTAEQARHQMDRVAARADRQVNLARHRSEEMLYQSPLAVGVAAMAVGAAIGLALPETPKEQQIMGEASDRLVERARETGTQMTEQMTEKARHVADEAKHAAEEEARKQGIAG